jgi:pimeloyl-ACP methyl ester carboxylesterase
MTRGLDRDGSSWYGGTMPIAELERMYASREVTIPHRGRFFRIAYVFRKGNGPAIVFLHGLGCRKEDFSGAFDQPLLAGYDLAAFDLPGCGRSPYADGMSLSIADAVDMLRKILDILAVGRAYLVGHSSGALIGMLFAEAHPERVLGLASIEGSYLLDDRHLIQKLPDLVFEKFLKRYKKFAYRIQRAEGAGMKRYADTLKRLTNPRAYYDYGRSVLREVLDERLLGRYAALTAPKLFMYGSKDIRLPICRAFREHPGLETAEIPNSSYFPNDDNPQAFYRSLTEWIGRLEAARGPSALIPDRAAAMSDG